MDESYIRSPTAPSRELQLSTCSIHKSETSAPPSRARTLESSAQFLQLQFNFMLWCRGQRSFRLQVAHARLDPSRGYGISRLYIILYVWIWLFGEWRRLCTRHTTSRPHLLDCLMFNTNNNYISGLDCNSKPFDAKQNQEKFRNGRLQGRIKGSK